MFKFKRLNNKGYMLVEIILASAIAMGIAYFITDLTIKLKNKNDDLLVKTLVSTDQAIIYNTIMKDLYNNSRFFECDNISVSDNVFKYNDFTNIVSEYAKLSYNAENDCSYDIVDGERKIKIKIKIDVPQLKDNFDVNIEYTNQLA